MTRRVLIQNELNVRPIVLRAAFVAAALVWSVAPASAAAQSDGEPNLALLEQQALRAVVEHVSPCVVRIETVGGLEKIGEMLATVGPTTGVIVSPDGYIVSSAFNFVQRPSSILVTLPGGSRAPAQLVATDHSRQLVLLKVDAPSALPTPHVAPLSEVKVGAWAIAVGRGVESEAPNVSVGIVSATGRIWSKAIQTDAKISPVNYGGALCDIRGRVMGLLVPMSLEESGDTAGAELYDSGIGFAVPMEHVLNVLPRLREPADLHAGLLGISLKSNDLYSDAPVIGAALPNSPARKAGLQAGDKILEIAGQKVERGAEVQHQLKSRYAGDSLAVIVERGDERIEKTIELVAKIDPYQRPFLGVLPTRDGGDGVGVRYVYDDSPAAKAGLKPGDRISKFNETKVDTRDALVEQLINLQVGTEITLEATRDGEVREVKLTAAAEPTEIPESLPPAETPEAADGAAEAESPPVGHFPLKLAEFENTALAFVPDNYDSDVAYGLVVWLHPASGFKDDELLNLWRQHCEERRLILLAPRAKTPGRWQASELEFIRKAIDQTKTTYNIDATRVVAIGQEAGGVLAYALAAQARELVRGVATIDAPLTSAISANDPVNPLAFYIASSKSGRFAKLARSAAERLTEQKFSVVSKDIGEDTRPLNEDELAEVVRWIDTLDRI